jgi:hypothetical protein
LPTGEEEVLFTSLLDTEKYPSEEFGEIYSLRWNEETYFDRVKNVMNIEMFAGLSEESNLPRFLGNALGFQHGNRFLC